MKTLFGAAILAAIAGVASADIAGTATLVKTMPLGEVNHSTRAVTPGATFSNVTTFGGQAYANGGAALVSGNLTTKYVSEELNRTNAAQPMTRFSFSVANLNSGVVSARARVRFHNVDGGGVNTGSYVTGYTFNLIAFAPGVSVFFANVAAVAIPQNVMMGITFDNAGAPTTTAVLLNNLGVGIFNPPDLGSSPDLAFTTTAASVGNVNNGPGNTFNFGGAPVANFGWEIVPAPSSLALLAMGGIVAGRRRR